jgi:hypothetical protein
LTLDDREHQVRFLIRDPTTRSFFAASSIPRPEQQAQASFAVQATNSIRRLSSEMKKST